MDGTPCGGIRALREWVNQSVVKDGFFSALSPEEMAPKWGDHLERKEKKVMKRKVIDFHDCKLKQQKLKTGDS